MLLVWMGLAAAILGAAGLLVRSLSEYRIPTL
jgi:hypothetical protein